MGYREKAKRKKEFEKIKDKLKGGESKRDIES